MQKHAAQQLAGSGGERARSIVSFYCRLAFSDLHSLTVDALLFVFGEEGASARQIASVLGSVDSRLIQRSVDRMPREILALTGGAATDDDEPSDASAVSEGMLIAVNYATALPYIYAHWRRSMAAALANLLRADEVAHRMLVSRALSEQISSKPAELFRVVVCSSCAMAFEAREVVGLSQCPECSVDLVVAEIARVRDILSGPDGVAVQKHSSVFLRDRRIFCQALAMEELFSLPFVLVDRGGVVTDHQNVLLLEEFSARSQGKAGTSLLFRCRKAMRVRLVAADSVEEARVAENEVRIAARAMYPPWFESCVLPDWSSPAGPPSRKKSRRDAAGNDLEPLCLAASHVADLHFAEFVEVPLHRRKAADPASGDEGT
jgi:hypothetical protein